MVDALSTKYRTTVNTTTNYTLRRDRVLVKSVSRRSADPTQEFGTWAADGKGTLTFERYEAGREEGQPIVTVFTVPLTRDGAQICVGSECGPHLGGGDDCAAVRATLPERSTWTHP